VPTPIEIDHPQVTEPRIATKPSLVLIKKAPPVRSERRAERRLFSDSLLESGQPEQRRRSLATTLSFAFQCVVTGILLILPLMFTEALPNQQLLTLLVAAPPPPPPPPPPAAQAVKIAQTDVLDTGQLRTPTRIPKKIEMVREEEAPPAIAAGVVGGIPGGIPGGQIGGVIGGIISSSSKNSMVIPRTEPVKRIRVSQGVTQGMVITKIEPIYLKLAVMARVTGVVLVKAIISRDGTITELQVISGHPILVPAAIEAVKQWRYRPYLLNGEPVEVETSITVTFQIAQ